MVSAGLKEELTSFYDAHYPRMRAEMARVAEEKHVSIDDMHGDMSKGVFQVCSLEDATMSVASCRASD